MRDITSYPGQVYDYVYGNFGLTGLIVGGVGIVVAAICGMTWFDRRK